MIEAAAAQGRLSALEVELSGCLQLHLSTVPKGTSSVTLSSTIIQER
jgi:hypothetical protein